MTIREAKDGAKALLDVLNKMTEAAGEDIKVLRINIDADGPGILLNKDAMRAVVDAFPELEASTLPMGEDFSGKDYWTMSINGVRVFTILLDEDERQEW